MSKEYKGEKVKLSIPSLTSEDVKEARKRVDKAVEMHKKAPLFSKADFDEVIPNPLDSNSRETPQPCPP